MTEKLANRLSEIDERINLMTPGQLTDAAGELVSAMADACDRHTLRVAGDPKELRMWVARLLGHSRMVIGLVHPVQKAVVREFVTVANPRTRIRED